MAVKQLPTTIFYGAHLRYRFVPVNPQAVVNMNTALGAIWVGIVSAFRLLEVAYDLRSH